ncbi:hypothetical protein [Pseudomonas sp. UV AK001]|uniref:hypothetical protein n=1 Tax=Pseudomonas sp. UV AK001 TaxID=3384791 RepID=UPI0038D36AE4
MRELSLTKLDSPLQHRHNPRSLFAAFARLLKEELMFHGLLRLSGILVLAVFFHPLAWAENATQVYTGTLGKTAIVLEVNTRTGEGRYFYQKYRKDLELEGSRDGDTLELSEGSMMDGDSRPTLRLHAIGSNWSGEWSNPAGKTLKVELQPAMIPQAPVDSLPYIVSLREKAPYEYLRLQGMKLQKGKTETFMGYTLQWWSEPKSQASLFEVVSGYSPQVLQRINQQLMGRLWGEVIAYFGCSGDYSQSSQPLWMTPSVMSVRNSTDYYCGGAYPDQSNDALNFDATTGQTLTLEDVLWVGQGQPLHYEQHDDFNAGSPGSSDAWSKYRTTELAPWLVTQLLKLYPRQMTVTAEGDNDGHYDESDPWQFMGWYFTEQGIKFDPSYPHVAAVCGFVDWSILPYSVVKQHPGAVKLQLPQG